MLILYVVLGAFVVGGGIIVSLDYLAPRRTRLY